MLYFEILWGRTATRWDDLSDKTRGYGIPRRDLLRVFDTKLAMVEKARDNWSEFASYDEDKHFSEQLFNEKYKNKHPVFWDMTNIHIPKPSDATMQRLTYSSYYRQNCFKGGIAVQTCGWIRTHNLWTGCVSDTAYQAKRGIFSIQKKFGEKDLVGEERKYIPFTNVFNKGYRNQLAA